MTNYRNLLASGAATAVLAFGIVASVPQVAFAKDAGVSAEIVQGQGNRQQGGQGGQGGQRGQGAGSDQDRGGQGGRSLESIFRDITGADEDGDDGEESDRPEWAGTPGGASSHGGGQPEGSGGRPGDTGSGRPANTGSDRGDLYGDLWVILRDENGIPILTEEGWVQPIDADGNLIPLDEEGAPIDDSLTIEVELGRLNVGRAPNSVLDQRAEEVVTLLNSATEITTDAAGRLVITADGETKTIDSPLENLAIYVALLTQGSIPGVGDLPGEEFDFLVDGAFTAEDLANSVSFLAAATDKADAFTLDEIAYINAFLDINTTRSGNVIYSEIDYSTFTYDRSDAYENVTATVIVQQPDGSWTVETVSIYDVVFDGEDATASGSLAAYTQAADDARTVVNFLHEYEIPASTLDDVSH